MFRFPVIVMGIRPVGLRLVEVTEDCRAADSRKGNPFPLTTGHELCLYRFWLEKGRLEMLHTETVEGATLGLLRRLQSESMLDSFCLAGETALPCILGIGSR